MIYIRIQSTLKDIHNKYYNETCKRISTNIVYFDDIKEAQYRRVS